MNIGEIDDEDLLQNDSENEGQPYEEDQEVNSEGDV